MPEEKNCIFCSAPVSEGQVCSWCGFSQQGNVHIPGTLEYGHRIDKYVLGDVIAIDGESTSYISFDTETQKRVIVKEFLPVSLVAPRDGRRITVQNGKEVLFKNLMMDFKDMYTALSCINNKAMAKIYNVFNANGTVYAVIENVKGDTLKQSLVKKGRPYTFKEARWLFQDLFLLLDQLEKLNITHGGISDETVLITEDNRAVLTGFAIRDLRVKNEHIVYKLYDGFSAPEQYNSGGFPGLYTDIYSVAALFYYAVMGTTYSRGVFETKDSSRNLPKYAIEALRYATKIQPNERIDAVADFVLMLDNKATVEKPAKPAKNPVRVEKMKKYIPIVAVILLIILFVCAVFMLNSGRQGQSSSRVNSVSVSDILTVPDLKGKNYSEIMNDEELNKYFYFNVSEEYNDVYRPGEVISHQPVAGTEVSRGSLIYITISKGRLVLEVPDGLVGARLENVKLRLDDMGIVYNVVEVAQSEEFPYGIVTGTDKPAGTPIKPQSDILTVYVANNAPLPTPTPTPTPQPSVAPSESYGDDSSEQPSDEKTDASTDSEE